MFARGRRRARTQLEGVARLTRGAGGGALNASAQARHTPRPGPSKLWVQRCMMTAGVRGGREVVRGDATLSRPLLDVCGALRCLCGERSWAGSNLPLRERRLRFHGAPARGARVKTFGLRRCEVSRKPCPVRKRGSRGQNFDITLVSSHFATFWCPVYTCRLRRRITRRCPEHNFFYLVAGLV